MKVLIVIGVMLLIMGSLGLSFALNHNYISNEEFKACQDEGISPPYQSVNQQQFNFWSGVFSLFWGLVILVFVSATYILKP
jgi:hypothetical protein